MHISHPLHAEARPRVPLRWVSAAILALVLAYANGFWLTALHGAIGAIERTGSPFARWLRDSTLSLPLMLLVVLITLRVVQRWLAQSRRAWAGPLAAALLLAGASSGLGIAQAAASSAYDYSFQRQHLGVPSVARAAGQPGSADLAGFAAAPPLAFSLYCDLRGTTVGNPTAQLEYATLMVHARALGLISAYLLVSNLAIVGTLLALRRGWLWPVAYFE